MPTAVSVLHDLMGSKLSSGRKLALLQDFDRVLGLSLVTMAHELSRVTDDERRLLDERAAARATKDWVTSDRIRAELSAGGLEVKDTAQGQRWVRKAS